MPEPSNHLDNSPRAGTPYPLNDTIEARAERLAQAREMPHLHTTEKYVTAADWCVLDHHTPAEQRAAALDASAVLWAWFSENPVGKDWQQHWIVSAIERMYDAIQRTEGPQ